MTDDETPLAGGTHSPVLRVGETVRRQAGPQAPPVHALLRHLERAGFDGAPRALGFDERGREVLSFLPGEVGAAAGAAVRSEEALVATARLLRRLHAATVGFHPPADAVWHPLVRSPAGEVYCHNDCGPGNTVFRDGLPCAFIDWDTAGPGAREWDVAYALYRWVPFIPDEICLRYAGWERPPDRDRRLHLFCAAYGIDDPPSMLEHIVRRVEAMLAVGDERHALGEPGREVDGTLRAADFWPTVMRRRLVRDIEFVRALQRGATRA